MSQISFFLSTSYSIALPSFSKTDNSDLSFHLRGFSTMVWDLGMGTLMRVIHGICRMSNICRQISAPKEWTGYHTIVRGIFVLLEIARMHLLEYNWYDMIYAFEMILTYIIGALLILLISINYVLKRHIVEKLFSLLFIYAQWYGLL